MIIDNKILIAICQEEKEAYRQWLDRRLNEVLTSGLNWQDVINKLKYCSIEMKFEEHGLSINLLVPDICFVPDTMVSFTDKWDKALRMYWMEEKQSIEKIIDYLNNLVKCSHDLGTEIHDFEPEDISYIAKEAEFEPVDAFESAK